MLGLFSDPFLFVLCLRFSRVSPPQVAEQLGREVDYCDPDTHLDEARQTAATERREEKQRVTTVVCVCTAVFFFQHWHH